MTARLGLEAQVTSWLEAAAPARAPGSILGAVIDRVEASPQERHLTQRIFGDRLGRSSRLRWGLAAVALGLAAGGTIAVGSLLLQRPMGAQNGWIVFAADSRGGDQLDAYPAGVIGAAVRDLYMTRDGALPRRIIGGDGLDHACPVFSKDGRTLAYLEASVEPLLYVQPEGSSGTGEPASFGSRTWTLVLVEFMDSGPSDLAGARRIPLPVTTVAMRPSCFEWSPDGSQLARAVPRDGNRVAGLELLAVATGQLRYLRYERDDWVPGPLQWSPDGSRIAFLRSGALGIIAADAEMASGLVPSGLPGVGASVSWSPDGRRIAVGTAGTETEAPRFRVMYVDNPGHDFLVFDGRDPVWSPDGKRVAALRGESRSIVILDPDGGGESVIALELPALSGVSWSPDGRRLLYAGGTGEGPVGFVTVSVDTPSDSALVTPITGALGRTTDVDFTWQEVQR